MSEHCDIDDSLTCRRCRRKAFSTNVIRNCSPGLGDMVSSGLSAVGITKARAQAVAQAVGLSDCGCEKRQQLLNQIGYRIGIGSPADGGSDVQEAAGR